MLSHYFADFVFLGAGAISPAGWLMDYTREEGELNSQMLLSARTRRRRRRSQQVQPLRAGPGGKLEKVTHLVTDRKPEAPMAEALAALPLELLVSSDTARS